MPESKQTIVFQLLEQHSTKDAVSAFLKAKGLKFSAQNWEKMFSDRLIPGLESGAITFDELHHLISEGEEYGKQHIFLYQLDESSVVEILSQHHVTDVLAKLALTNLPKMVVTPDQTEIVDVRLIPGNSLTIKSLSPRISRHMLSDDTVGTRQTMVWDLRTERAVNIVNLDITGMVQVRLQSISGASKHYANELDEFWDLVDPFIPVAKVTKTPIQSAKGYLWENRLRLTGQVRYTDSTLRNDKGFKVYATGDNKADINSDAGISQGLDVFYRMKGYCDAANIWLIKGTEADPEFIHVILSGDVNEYHLPQKCSRLDHEYCLNKLREFNQEAPV